MRRYSRMMTSDDRVKIERRISVTSAAEQHQRIVGSQWNIGDASSSRASGGSPGGGRTLRATTEGGSKRMVRGMTAAEKAAAERALAAKVVHAMLGCWFAVVAVLCLCGVWRVAGRGVCRALARWRGERGSGWVSTVALAHVRGCRRFFLFLYFSWSSALSTCSYPLLP